MNKVAAQNPEAEAHTTVKETIAYRASQRVQHPENFPAVTNLQVEGDRLRAQLLEYTKQEFTQGVDPGDEAQQPKFTEVGFGQFVIDPAQRMGGK
jgi:hypothetical protein